MRIASVGFAAHKTDTMLKKTKAPRNNPGNESGKIIFLFKRLFVAHEKMKIRAPILTNERGVPETVGVGRKGSRNKNQINILENMLLVIPGSRNSTFY